MFFFSAPVAPTFITDAVSYGKHLRHAFIGFTSSVVADTLCNPIRVLKVNRQTSLTRTGASESSEIGGWWGEGWW